MTKAVLKFPSLQEMAAYLKQIHLDEFIMDTKSLTLMSSFNDGQFAVAMNDYGAFVLRKL